MKLDYGSFNHQQLTNQSDLQKNEGKRWASEISSGFRQSHFSM